jgi:protein ImuB
MVWRRISYRFVKASGPERLAAEWQHLNLRLQLIPASIEAAQQATARYYFEGKQTRDYYMAEDEEGRRFWLFRAGLFGIADDPRWFMHGVFG